MSPLNDEYETTCMLLMSGAFLISRRIFHQIEKVDHWLTF